MREESTRADGQPRAATAWHEPGTYTTAAGVHRIPLPLPGDGLKAVNVYVLVQPEGLVVIDSGWGTAASEAVLERGLHRLGHELGDVRQFLCTHLHRDHYLGAMRMRQRFGSRVSLGAGERRSADYVRHHPLPAVGPMVDHLRRCGAEELATALQHVGVDGDAEIGTAPQVGFPDVWLQDEQQLELPSGSLRVLATPGHTQGHVVFVHEEAGLLFSGDHVLPHITPSIGFEAVLPASPLRDFLASLARVRALPDMRMLPAHGPVRPSFHDRIDALTSHHEVRLRLSRAAVNHGARTPFEVASELPWTRSSRAFDDLDAFNQALAVNETAAHLTVLEERGELGSSEVVGPHGPVLHYVMG